VGTHSLDLNAINNSASFFVAKWTPALRRNQSRDVLRLLINKLYGVSHGQVFASHAALGDALDLSREWTCTLIGRLRETGWIRTEARRLPNGTQEVTIFRAGRMLKRLLMMLVCARQRQPASRVNDSSQKFPTPEQVERNKHFLQQLIRNLAEKLPPLERKRWRKI
jgi:hypothetical protein